MDRQAGNPYLRDRKAYHVCSHNPHARWRGDRRGRGVYRGAQPRSEPKPRSPPGGARPFLHHRPCQHSSDDHRRQPHLECRFRPAGRSRLGTPSHRVLSGQTARDPRGDSRCRRQRVGRPENSGVRRAAAARGWGGVSADRGEDRQGRSDGAGLDAPQPAPPTPRRRRRRSGRSRCRNSRPTP